MKEIGELIIKISNSNSDVCYTPLPQDDPMQRKPCIKKAKQILNWEPKVQLEDGLIKTIAYFRKKIENRSESASDPLEEKAKWIHYPESHV